jgi:hemolysin activation/secretion protein
VELRAPAQNILGSGVWLTPAVFYDISEVYLLHALYPQKDRYRSSGTGLSVRTRGAYGLRLEADLAVALDDGDQTKAGDTRLHARLLWDF